MRPVSINLHPRDKQACIPNINHNNVEVHVSELVSSTNFQAFNTDS